MLDIVHLDNPCCENNYLLRMVNALNDSTEGKPASNNYCYYEISLGENPSICKVVFWSGYWKIIQSFFIELRTMHGVLLRAFSLLARIWIQKKSTAGTINITKKLNVDHLKRLQWRPIQMRIFHSNESCQLAPILSLLSLFLFGGRKEA